jgi:Putative Actinobacterial Holin-X, holin superfamily III
MHPMFWQSPAAGTRLSMSIETKPPADAPIGELIGQLSAQTSRLVRDEMRLAQKEFQQAAKHAGIGAGLFSGAGLLAFFGFAAMVTAGVAALAIVVPLWAASLIVAAALFVAAGVAALISKRQIAEVSPPRATVESVKTDISELKGAARHGQT